MQACVFLILIGYKKQKGKRHLKKRRKKQIILYYCLSLISDTTLSYSLLGLAPGTGPTPFLFDYTLSLRDAPDILMLFLSSFCTIPSPHTAGGGVEKFKSESSFAWRENGS